MLLEQTTPLHLPDLHLFERDGITYAVEPRGRELLDLLRDEPGRRSAVSWPGTPAGAG